jgi:hypothetical protein
VGYLVALLLASITRPLLNRIGFDRLTAQLGLTDERDPKAGSRWSGSIVFALVILAAIMQAARSLELQFVAEGIARFFGYLPHLLAAAFIFGIALLFGNWARDRMIHSAEAKEGQRGIAASTVRAGILAVGAFMALRELQIAPEIVTVAFTVTVAAIGLAAALAFGLGGRAVAGQVAQRWYERGPRAGNGASTVDTVRAKETRGESSASR